MKIGIPKEIKSNEYRVSMTPSGVLELARLGHEVFVQQNAGTGSGYTDHDYEINGAKILTSLEEIYTIAELIVKVKEPLPEEYKLITSEHTVFTYFHFASSVQLTHAMIQSGSTCIAYETVIRPDKSLPLLTPMSEIAGRMSIQEGAKYLEKPMGGRGVLLGGVPGVDPANVLILGAGVVGTHAAKMAAGLGANVKIFDVNLDRLRAIDDIMPRNVSTLFSNYSNIKENLLTADLVIGAVLIPGAKAPILVEREHLKLMKPGSVLVDVAVDQGGCIETCKPTTHANPTFEIDGILHYCVANMPGAVPNTSTKALTNATLPFVIQLASLGWKKAIDSNPILKTGVNIAKGKIHHKSLADSLNLTYEELN